MAVTGYASRRHYADHLRPITDALGATIVAKPPTGTALVASWADLRRCKGPAIYMEHGAGQTYDTRSPCYAGAPRPGAVAVLAPNEHAAAAHRATSDIPVHVVGCPKLDALLALPKPMNDHPVVAVSHHWNCHIVPETRPAYDHHKRAYEALTATFPGAVGHAHPRIYDRLSSNLTRAGFDCTPGFTDVCSRADVYVCDNSSTLFEFAALDRPVVVLNAPWYRRDVHHGGRFWDWADIGIQVDHPHDLIDAIHEALTDPPEVAARRREIVADIYPHLGTATTRAVEAIRQEVAA